MSSVQIPLSEDCWLNFYFLYAVCKMFSYLVHCEKLICMLYLDRNIFISTVKPKNARPLCYCAYFSNGFARCFLGSIESIFS